METKAHHVLIGVFALAAGAAALLFALWLSQSLDENSRLYEIVFREPVAGLSAGSPVQYSGIRVGEVESLALDNEDPSRVRAIVRVSGDAPVRNDTRARLTLINITGAGGIELSGGDAQGSRLTAPEGEIPVIEAEPSPLAQLRFNSDELLLGLRDLLDNANRILSEENADHLNRVVSNLDTLTTQLASQQDSLRDGMQSLARAGDQLDRLTARLDEQLTRHGEPMLADAASTMANMERVSERLDALVRDNRQAFDSGMDGVAGLGPAMQELRGTLETMSRIADRLEDDPGGFLLGRDRMQEFQP